MTDPIGEPLPQEEQDENTKHNELSEGALGHSFETLILYTDSNKEDSEEPAGITMRGDLEGLAIGLYRMIHALGNQAVETGAVDPEAAEKHSYATLGMFVMEQTLSALQERSKQDEASNSSVH